ncbi:hypothetical protein PMA3_16555 [Pseudomonas silesiensis]|uniref:Uncharacterized protein n=1 Tax=Pseudomonas silesiensis TaxID=1853130 RepID=A0A191YUW9_9PSED|nr:hypothetical protein PMA3_16555 [Pseudomonas silesiensis]
MVCPSGSGLGVEVDPTLTGFLRKAFVAMVDIDGSDDRVFAAFVSASSRASSLPQGGMSFTKQCHTAEHCGSELARDGALSLGHNIQTNGQPPPPILKSEGFQPPSILFGEDCRTPRS